MKKKYVLAGILLLLASLLTSCGYSTVEEMYRIPKRSQEYTFLQSTIEQAMTGLEFASPTMGDNQQTVQAADLDGDGKTEYLVFARDSSDKPLKVLIFHETEDEKYFLMERLEMNGSSFEQVIYADMDGCPGTELIIGRRLTNQVMRIAAVYSFADGQGEQQINTIYSKFLTADLTCDGKQELIVIREGDTDVSAGSAVVFRWGNSDVERTREIRLSQRVEQIKRLKVSRLESGDPAVYISSTINDSAIVTDVLVMQGTDFVNLNSTGKLAYSVQALRNYFLYMNDVDEDGVMELPSLMEMRPVKPEEQGRSQQMVYWYSIDMDGKEIPKMYTFHNVENGWYLLLDVSTEVAQRIAVERDGNSLRFYIWEEEAKPLFTLNAYTGNDRNQAAQANNQFVLYQTNSVVYAAKLEVQSAAYGITQESLTGAFRLMGMDLKKEG